MDNSEIKKIIVSDDIDSVRLDKFIVDELGEYSRSRIQQWIREGFVSVNSAVETKTGAKIGGGDTIQVHIPPVRPTEIIPEAIPLTIIYEDKNLIVINKAAGMVVHPSAGHDHGTLVHAILAHAPDIEGVGGEIRPGVVHRLDKGTSGILLMAKNDQAHHWLQEQFRLRAVEKTYLALVEGHPPTSKGRIEASIGRDLVQRKKMAVVSPNKGRDAISIYSTEKKYKNYSYLKVNILTGRTHQIRLHMAFVGCPVVGDTTYGKKHPSIKLGRNFLHAYKLSICLPGEENKTTFEAALPAELESVLTELDE
ncbi:MAG: RluA family pseudouridine synthase [Anaerolineaceae bacterium]|nr:RluA family pseudouridine synthase [Anaerolineaceae bacterium]